MNFNITSDECAYAHFQVQILTRTVKGLRGFGVKKEIEKEAIYGAGNEPIDITEGNKKYSGSIKLLGFEVDAMNAVAAIAGFGDITEVPHELIVISISYKRRPTDTLKRYVVNGAAFTECGVDMEQNAKHREITLPFIAMSVDFFTF